MAWLFSTAANTTWATPVVPLRKNHERESYMHGNEYQELKSHIHSKLLDTIDLSLLRSLNTDYVRQEIRQVTGDILEEEVVPLNARERELLLTEVQDEVLGLGPLEPLLQDPTVSDILVNTHKKIYVERFGKLESTAGRFKDDTHLMGIIEKIVAAVGRRIDESSPMVDARLPGGIRVNAIIPPLAIDGPILSMRRFAVRPLQLEDLVSCQTLTPAMGELLQGVVKARLNVLISGGTGSGKTTLLNVLSGFIPAAERIVTIEDAAELQLQQPHVVRLETRPPNIEDKGQVTQRDLVRNSLRMRPDRIIVGEVRGAEAIDMLQAMNTGHDGSLTTIHANSARDALLRLEAMVSMSGLDIPARFLRHYLCSALNMVVHVARLSDGTRKVTSLHEITGIEGEVITLQEIFSFVQTGVAANGTVKGRFQATGLRPQCVERLQALGLFLPDDLFDPRTVHEI